MAITKIKKPRTVHYITEEEAIAMFQAIDGKAAAFINVVLNTDARPLKKNRVTGEAAMFQSIRKISKRFSVINQNYSNAVNAVLRKEGKEGTFVAQERSYGEKNDEFNGCILYQNGTPMLVLQFTTCLEKYLVDGKLTDYEKIKDYLPVPKAETVHHRNIKFSGVTKFYFNKAIYKIKR